MRPLTPNIIKIYNSANDRQITEGMNWYNEAHSLCLELDPNNPARAAGIIAALSPLQSWEINKRFARQTYMNGNAAGSGLYSNVAKANAIFEGGNPLDILGGDKVINFFKIILNPDCTDGVVIDRHAFDIAVGRKTNDAARSMLSRKGMYDRFANAYRRGAKQIGISPSMLQAVTWVTWREL